MEASFLFDLLDEMKSVEGSDAKTLYDDVRAMADNVVPELPCKNLVRLLRRLRDLFSLHDRWQLETNESKKKRMDATFSWKIFQNQNFVLDNFDPAFGLLGLNGEGIREVDKIVLLSGTLFPIYDFEYCFDGMRDFDEREKNVTNEFLRLRNGHSVPKENTLSLFTSQTLSWIKAQEGTSLNLLCTSPNWRENTDFTLSLGLSVNRLTDRLPPGNGGILIIFPSKFTMQHTIDVWKKTIRHPTAKNVCTNVWEKLSKNNVLFVENEDHHRVMVSFKKIVDNKKRNAIFFCYMRGNLTEGCNLPNRYCRMAIILGIPIANVGDPTVIGMKNFFETKYSEHKPDFLELDAARVMVQAAGRVYRTPNDFGCVILLDSRSWFKISKYFPDWMRKIAAPFVTNTEKYVAEFFDKRAVLDLSLIHI